MLGACSPTVLPCAIQPSQPGNRKIVLLGNIGSGKSSVINTAVGRNVAESQSGPGARTRINAQHASIGLDLWDTQSLSDENPLSAQVPLAKAADVAIAVAEAPGSLKNIRRLLRVLQALKKRTIVVINKIDQVQPEEVEGFKATIRKEMESLCAPGTPWFFISTKSPETTAAA